MWPLDFRRARALCHTLHRPQLLHGHFGILGNLLELFHTQLESFRNDGGWERREVKIGDEDGDSKHVLNSVLWLCKNKDGLDSLTRSNSLWNGLTAIVKKYEKVVFVQTNR